MIRIFTVLLFAASLPAQTVTPANPSVRTGGTVQMTADRPVTWSLLPGSVGTIDSSGLYRAPATLPAGSSMGGCQIGAPDSVFNTPVDRLPADANSQTLMAALPATSLSIDPSWGTNVVDHNTPVTTFNFLYTPAYNAMGFQLPAWPALKRENGVFSDPQTDVDRHVLSINRETCRVYEIYNNYPAGTAGSTPPASLYTAQSGLQYNSTDYTLPSYGSTDAAGLPLAPTTLHLDEIRAGVIRHAMRVTFGNAYIAPRFIWPATSNSFAAHGAVPFGTRLRLKSGTDISGFSPFAQVILTALKQYGMIISDGGANWDIITSTDVTADPDVAAAIQEIQIKTWLINSTQFEIVDESALMDSASSAHVKYSNGYVTPPAFAIVKADDGTHLPVTLPIALQGPGISSPEGGGIWIQAGVTRPLSVYVAGAADTSVTWSLYPGFGTLLPNGTFTAPSVNRPTTLRVTATSVADPSVSLTFPVTVMPAGPIRITAGNATGNPAAPNQFAPSYGPDSNGDIWWSDQAVERGWGVRNDYWYGAPWPQSPDIYRYETQYYNIGDTVYRFSVPNGNYRIDYYVAQGACPVSNVTEPLIYREHLEAQGQIAAYDYHPLSAIGGSCYTPVHTSIPAQVTNTDLYFAIRRITDPAAATSRLQQPVTILSSFSITPVSDPPHLTIDPPNPPVLNAGQTLKLHAIGWYMQASVTWGIISGPGTISSDGIYSSPPLPQDGTVVVQAVSTVDPTQTAALTITLRFGTLTINAASPRLPRGTSVQFQAALSGQPYSNVTWTVSPSVGSVNSAGQYTAPDLLRFDTMVTLTATSRDDSSRSVSAQIVVTKDAPTLRINAGDSGGFTDAAGNIWSDDTGYSGPTQSYHQNVAIAGTTADLLPLYQSSRYCYAGQSFSYTFTLPNGLYTVGLKFADYTFTAAGNYMFNVAINGTNVLQNFDPDAASGARTAVDKTFVIAVTGKSLVITFTGVLNAAFVNGLIIKPLLPAGRLMSGSFHVGGTAY